MRQFECWRFAEIVHGLTRHLWIAIKRDEKEVINPRVLAELSNLTKEFDRFTVKLNLKASGRCANALWNALSAYGAPEFGRVKTELHTLFDHLFPELRERQFAFVDSAKTVYVEELLGKPPTDLEIISRNRKPKKASAMWLRIWKLFPSAKYDCEEAVYCYALDRNTACVFHSMRAVEIGLRGLARRMNVKLPKGKRLEWAEWQTVLHEMSRATEVIANTKAGPKRDALLEVYRGALGQFYGFKDEFRNQVMHVRKHYDDKQASRALDRTRDFMYTLSKQTDEKGRIVRGRQ